jgi:hypothetical protein
MRSVILAALAGVLALVLAPAAMGSQVEPTLISGNPSCAGGVKIEPVRSGTYLDGALTITTTNTSSGQEFSFATNGIVVTSVIVKGGPNANFYDYTALGGVSSDTGLHSPLNTSNGRWYGLSHLCFFTDDKKPPPPPK